MPDFEAEEPPPAWAPDQNKGEADKLRLTGKGHYLKEDRVDDLDVKIELDQRSRGSPREIMTGQLEPDP